MGVTSQTIFAVVTTWVLWHLFRSLYTASLFQNIPGPPAQSRWKGHVDQYFHRYGWEFQKQVAQNYGTVVKLYELFGRSFLYLYDPKALHAMLLKDQNAFEETEEYSKMNALLFGPGVLAAVGAHHRKQRKMLNPVFSVNHMRHMLPTFYSVINKLRSTLASRVAHGPQEIDMLQWIGRTAVELIGQAGLGYSFDDLSDDSPDTFVQDLKAMLPTIVELTPLLLVAARLSHIGPAWVRRLVVDYFPNKRVQKLKLIVDTMAARSAQIFHEKKLALQKGDEAVTSQISEGKDIMSILVRANMSASEEDRLQDEELIAQMSTLIFSALDSTSNTIARILHRLAERPDIQEKIRTEVVEAQAAGGLSYDELIQLPFLDAVCRETLRVDPPATLNLRVALRDTKLPLSEPVHGVDGTFMTELPIPKGSSILIGVLGSNTNKAIWGDDASEWKPERWLQPLPSALSDAAIPGVFSNLMTFSGGVRACIGFKFSEMEMKVVLSVLLATFTFELTERPIVWNVAHVCYPTVGKESNDAQLPLKVGLVQMEKR